MNDEQRFALRSIEFHAAYGDDERWPDDYRPLPLEQAASILSAANEPDDESPRRRAIARLLASPLRSTTQPESAYNRAIVALAPALRQIPLVLAELATKADTKIGARAANTFLAYSEWLVRRLGPTPGCERTPPQTSIDFDRHTQLISARSSMRVRRPLDDLRRTMDPQNWDVVIPKYFRKTCIADCSMDVSQADARDYDALCDASPPPAGSNWTGILFEHYELDIGKHLNLVTFKNLLDCSSQGTKDRHEFHYKLNSVLYAKIGLLTKLGGGLDRDDGEIRLSQDADGWVDLHATKLFRLDGWELPLGPDLDFLLNWWTSVTIGTTLDASYEAVCKQV